MEPIISVIVPVYNVEPYLEECVKSLQDQTLREIEIVLVDDGSPDKCPQMCDRYAEEDGRIRVIHQENAGVSAARNAGLRMVRGKYIAFVDPDDWVDPDYLSVLLEHMVPGGMAVCDYVREWDPAAERTPFAGQRERYETVALDRKEAQASVIMRSNNEKTIYTSSWCKLYDRNLIQMHQVAFCEDLTQFEDELFVIRYLSCLTGKTVWARTAAYHYRYRLQGAGSQWMHHDQKVDPWIFSELIALERESPYLERTSEVQRYHKARLLSAKKDPLAMMSINGQKKELAYKTHLRELRAGLFSYLRYGGCSFIDKSSTVLCAIHPRLYHLCKAAAFFILDRVPKLWLLMQRGL